MAFALIELVIQLDDGTPARVPAPPASTGGAAYALLDTDGVLSWGVTTGAELLVDDASGELLYDDATSDVIYDG